MKKSEPPKAAKREDGVDLISSMPDDILVSILSHLPHTEEVIRSSILSECLDGACDPSLPNLRNLVLNTTMDAFTMDNFKRVLKYYPKLVYLELVIEQDFHGKYACLDKDETMRISTPDMKKV
ncbi:unnamed protein product [Lactuca virosa]|uniref:F-box domain-containing protein n=1 Tax=Lactuca virosa TaxID=75947 RepID=A0AAU9N253_9ASTR|nr:unnamed protein product [Lactuca virosa]